MTILWCGGEDIDFPVTSGLSIATGAGFRSGYARCGLSVAGGGGYAESLPFPGGAIISGWFSFRLGAVQSNKWLGIAKRGTAGKGIYVGSNGSSKVSVLKFDGSTATTLATESGATLSGYSGIHKFDVQFTGFGSACTFTVYYDGAPVAGLTSVTVDASVSGIADLDCVYMHSNTGASPSEFVVADEDTRLFSLVTLAPNAAGDANAWTGAYTDVSETTTNDATELYTNTVAQDAQINLSDLPAGAFTIRGVRIAARCARSAVATAGSIALGVKTNGSISPGTTVAESTSWATQDSLLVQNPLTSNDWQQSEINALQLNFRSAT